MKKQTIIKWIALCIVLCCFYSCETLKTTETNEVTETSNPASFLHIKADEVTANVSPLFYGLMTEEINHSYDGGLYAELIRNRIFKEVPIKRPRTSAGEEAKVQQLEGDGLMYWELVETGGGVSSMSQDKSQPMNNALTNSLKLEITSVGENQRVGISNDGFWGIPVRPKTKYRARIHVKGGNGFTGPLTLAIVDNDGETVYAKAKIHKITDSYQKYEVTLKTGKVKATKDARFHIWAGDAGTVWFSLVSLFQPTYKNRPNGNRIDIMKLLADMKPTFLRFPGGNYVEGGTIATRFDWKSTLSDISERPGHANDIWEYWSSDGMGMLEFLQWCEDLDMEPVIVVYAGYSMTGERAAPGAELEPFVQDALDQIEYTIGDTSTTWGARRAKDGHPEPFKLTYVEIGNEEDVGSFRSKGNEYDVRFTQFYDAIRAKYPQLKIIGATPVTSELIKTRTPDVYDDHYYRSSVQMQADTHHYDNFDRNGPKIFVGEWATREGLPTPNLGAALGDAAWLTGLERNSDVVVMESYAPLFVNVNPGAMQWRTDLIGYDALTSYGSPAYYVQKMFSCNHGDTVLAVTEENIPSRQVEMRRRKLGGGFRDYETYNVDVPWLFYNVTRDTKNGTMYVKLVNCSDTPQSVRIQISGVSKIKSKGKLIQLKGESPEGTNSITDPENIVPVTMKINGISKDFTRTFPPYSISVLILNEK